MLVAAGLEPRHRWGQNFLIDLNLMRLLVDAADLNSSKTVLEVGCRTGSLTESLADSAGAVVSAEIDERLVVVAGAQLFDRDNVTLICGDVLRNKNTIAPAILESITEATNRLGGEFALVANLPYQVASPLIVNLLLLDQPSCDAIFVTVQAEVAQRMIAPANTTEYGLLSILMQALGEVELLRWLGPQAFWPAPKVNSAMVAWHRDPERQQRVGDVSRLKALIDLFLRHRRKKIQSCLKTAPSELLTTPTELLELLGQAGIDPNVRGETLSVEQYATLSYLWSRL